MVETTPLLRNKQFCARQGAKVISNLRFLICLAHYAKRLSEGKYTTGRDNEEAVILKTKRLSSLLLKIT